MKQVVQNYKTGDLKLEDVPVPVCTPGCVLVRTEYSVVSTGTEKMKVDQARMNLLEKARTRPDQVRKVLQSVSQVGIKETLSKVQERLDSLTPLGYSSIGRVEQVGGNIDHLKIGDRVVCAGEGIACHAEWVSVPKNLCARVDDDVPAVDAAFATVGAIAMNGIRQARLAIGDTVVVIGLGLVGLLAIQLLRAAGCRIVGIDLDPAKVELARKAGAHASFMRNDPGLEAAIAEFTGGHGVDCTYIAASARSADPMHLAGQLTRDRGNVVIVGMVPIEAEWREYYAKELNVLLSRSYGPGRYDPVYEQRGIDYPIGYVPWTLQRNLKEFVRLVADGAVRPSDLGVREYPFDQAPDAYQALHGNATGGAAAIVFHYESTPRPAVTRIDTLTAAPPLNSAVGVGLIGVGNFATGTLIPALKRCGNAELVGACSARGLSAKSTANRHTFRYAASDYQELLDDPDIHAVVIATRHNTHAAFASAALSAGKHVFVEKPLALKESELAELANTAKASPGMLMPGFNRRFSPLSEGVRNFFAADGGALEMMCRVNAGPIPADSWYQDPEEGGWRIVSEGCHWIDLMSYVCRSHPSSVSATIVGGDVPGGQNDNCIATLRFENGTIGTLGYFSNGAATFPKERLEVFGQDKVAVIDNWHAAHLHGDGTRKTLKPGSSGKGHNAEMAAFVSAIKDGGDCPISLSSALATTATTFAILESLRAGGAFVDVVPPA